MLRGNVVRVMTLSGVVASMAVASLVVAPAQFARDGRAVVVDRSRGEVRVRCVVQDVAGKPCVDAWGQRVQAFAGCRTAAGAPAKFSDYFPFLAQTSAEEVFRALEALGARAEVHCSVAEGQARPGLVGATTAADYLQGDPVVLSVSWTQAGRRVERPYEWFVDEQLVLGATELLKPWTPHFAFHGSGALHASGTGCIACPCDCPGGLIADNRWPIYNPKPVVRFVTARAPRPGTEVWLRIRPVCSRP